MTKLVYHSNVNEEEEAIQKENQSQRKLDLLFIQAYDKDEKSAITFVIYNSLEKAPEGRSYCKEAAECNFMRWFEKSSIFEKYINDGVTKFAHCCKTMKDEFPMLLDIEIEEVMEINTIYEPIILIVKENEMDTLFPIESSEHDTIPFSSIQVLSEKQLTDKLSPNTVKMYFCPHRTWLNKLRYEDTQYIGKYTLFEKRFDEDEVYRCNIQPWYISWNPLEEYQLRNCLSTQGLTFRQVGMRIGYTLMEVKTPETKKVFYKNFREGIDKLIDYVKTGQIQNEDIKVESRIIEMYQLCYEIQTKRTHWIIREITPWAQVERDLNKQEELYTQEHNNNSGTTLHKIVPSEENSFQIWQHATSYEHNLVLVSLKLKPLIDLIDQRLEKYSKRVSRSIKVMTKLVYHSNVNNEEEAIQEENQNQRKPELLLIQAYDEDEKSAITFVIHNSLEKAPEGRSYCKETAECNFMKWFEKSSIFKKYINDSVTKYAYCCKTLKDEFPMLLDTKIEEVMEINTIYEPVILMVKENQIDKLFPMLNSVHDVIPFGSIQILSKKQMTHPHSPNTVKLYFCPHRTWLNKLKFEDTQPPDQFSLFEKRFDEDEAHRCSAEPWYISSNPKEKYRPTNCLSRQGLTFQKVGIQIGYTLIKQKISEIKEIYKRYNKGMDELIHNIRSDQIQNENITVVSRMIEMYQLCYDKQRKKTHWIIREITPWAQVECDLKHEELYAQEHNNNSGTTLHKIVPSEENSIRIWQHATSQEHNHVLVSSKLKPLIDLINKRLEKYSKQVSRSIKVMTKLIYNENMTGEDDTKQKENPDYWRPGLLLIQAYDEYEKSAITFVIHNSLEKQPEESIYCKETTKCNFMKWFEKSSIFEKYINDSVTKFAQCCKTIKDDFPMLLNIEIKEVIEINMLYEPVILMVQRNQIDTLYPIESSEHSVIPFSSIQILNEKQSTDEQITDNVKIYFCPHKMRRYKVDRKDIQLTDQFALFEKHFSKDEAYECSSKPWYISSNPIEKYKPTNCLPIKGLIFQEVGVQISYPLKRRVSGMENDRRYTYTMDELIKMIDSGEIQNEDIEVKSRMIQFYQLCYDNRNKTHWIIREITPWAQVEHDLKKQEELYTQAYNNNSGTTLHKIVPSGENSFKIWQHATSYEHNLVLVSLKLKPLIDLIDQSLQKYSARVFRSIKVMTKLIYNENMTREDEKQKENTDYWRPELLLIQAYDEEEKSAITFVIHNSLEEAPEGRSYCKEAAECNFMRWFEKSSIFEKYINDSVTKFAHCCKTIKDEFPMLLDVEIKEVMEINTVYEPIILMAKENQIDTLFPIESSEYDAIPFSSIQILSEKQLTDQLSPYKVKMYFCPHRTWLNKLKLEDTQQIGQFILFENRFNEDEVHRCSIQPWYISWNPIEEYQPTNCLPTQGLTFQEVGVQIIYPLKRRVPGMEHYRRYTYTMDVFIKMIDSGKIQKDSYKIASRMIQFYQLCYDNRKKTHWIIREITPWAQVEHDLKKQEELYTQEHYNNSGIILHKIVPSEENSFKIWQHATYYERNQVLVSLKLKPLIDLIHQSLQKYSARVFRSIKVMTKLFYNENMTREDENIDYWRPELLLIQAYDEEEKSAITFVIHNSLEEPPEESIYCKETTKCNFMKWFEKSSIFEEYINDSVTKFAHCCKTMKDEFPMLLDIEIKEVMEINTVYEPVILMAKENQIDTLFPIESSKHDAIPLSSIQILSEKQLTDKLSPNTVKMYFCPHRTWLNKLKLEDTQQIGQFILFEKRFNEDEVHRCSIQPWYISWNPREEYQPTNCLSTQGLTFQEVGMQIGYTLIKLKTTEIEKVIYKHFRKGMDKLIDNVKTGQIQSKDIEVKSRMIQFYQLCYDNRKKTHWIIREITPWAQVERDSNKQEELYTQEHNINSGTTLHKIVPSEENSFKIWQHATSYEHNLVLVSLKLKPLIDLIDQRLEKYSTRVSRSIKVMTKLIHNENMTGEDDTKQKGNPDYWRPELLLIQAYDEEEKSGITFVIHNSIENPPEASPFCEEPVKCDFMTWFEKSSIFEKYINDSVTKFAQCCQTMKDEFPMLLDIEIKEVMEMNWDSNIVIQEIV